MRHLFAAALIAAIVVGHVGAETQSSADQSDTTAPGAPPKWELFDFTDQVLSSTTKDSNGVQCHSACEYCSPDGKYCASAAHIRAAAPGPDEEFLYRFAKPSPEIKCHNYVVVTGPKGGWNDLILCRMAPNQMFIEAIIIGWTSPQSFLMSIPIERRKR